MTRPLARSLAIGAVLLAGACAQQPPSTTPARNPAAVSTTGPREPTDAAAAAAGPTLTIEDARPPVSVTRYTAPRDCPLTYDYRAAYRMDMAAVGFGSGFDMLGQLEARADGASTSRATVKFVWARTDVVAPTGSVKGVRTDQNLGSVQLVTDGSRWTEVEQKSKAPVAMPNFLGYAGIVNLWPTLPAAAEPGSTSQWKVPPQTIGGLALSAFSGVKQPAPTVEIAPLRVSKWIKVGGELAVVLEGSWEKEQNGEEKSGNQKVLRRATVRGAARFVVLASGRLLNSEVRQATDTLVVRQGERLATEVDQPSNDTHEDLTSELRLVNACGGVAMPSLHPPPTPDERAMMLHARLRDLASKGDRASLAALLAPSLTSRQGKDAVVDALLAHVKRFGENSLGMPTSPTPGSVRVDTDRVRFDLVGICVQNAGAAESFVVTVSVELERKGEDLLLRGIKAVTQGEGPSDVLEVSESRLFKGDPPSGKFAPKRR